MAATALRANTSSVLFVTGTQICSIYIEALAIIANLSSWKRPQTSKPELLSGHLQEACQSSSTESLSPNIHKPFSSFLQVQYTLPSLCISVYISRWNQLWTNNIWKRIVHVLHMQTVLVSALNSIFWQLIPQHLD